MNTTSSQDISKPSSVFNGSSTIPVWLDGVQVVLGSTFDVVSPVDGSTLYQASSANEEDVLRAVHSAEASFKTWSKSKPNFRRDIFLRASELFLNRRKELQQYSMTETGTVEAIFSRDLEMAADACKSIAGLIQVASSSSSPVVAEEGSSSIIYKEPYGVVLGIAPWNAPYVLGVRACLQPLAMGNTVVFKAPEAAPATSWAIGSVLHEAGLPAGCLNTINHRSEDASRITNALISHPCIKKINFTGSTAVGSIIASLAGKYLKSAVMELGGKAPSIICQDADLELAAFNCAAGAFLNAGQICMSTERILVHSKIYGPFRAAFAKALNGMYCNPQDGGKNLAQLISRQAVEKNRKLLADALEKGAGVFWGDARQDVPNQAQMHPVVIENILPDMALYSTESFGPMVSLHMVKSDEEAIRIANDTEYGLTSAVFTEDLRRGLRIAKTIETGAVHINSMSVHDEPALPHGGAKKSGFGRFNGLEGLGEWTRLKAVTWRD